MLVYLDYFLINTSIYALYPFTPSHISGWLLQIRPLVPYKGMPIPQTVLKTPLRILGRAVRGLVGRHGPVFQPFRPILPPATPASKRDLALPIYS